MVKKEKYRVILFTRKSAGKWTYTVQTWVVQGSTVYMNNIIFITITEPPIFVLKELQLYLKN